MAFRWCANGGPLLVVYLATLYMYNNTVTTEPEDSKQRETKGVPFYAVISKAVLFHCSLSE